MFSLLVLTPSLLVNMIQPVLTRVRALDTFVGLLEEDMTSRLWLHDTYFEEEDFEAVEQTLESMRDISEMYFVNNVSITECVTECVDTVGNVSELLDTVEGGEPDEVETLLVDASRIFDMCTGTIEKVYSMGDMVDNMAVDAREQLYFATRLLDKRSALNEMHNALNKPLLYNLTQDRARVERMRNWTGWIIAHANASVKVDTLILNSDV